MLSLLRQVALPDPVMRVRESLARNIHEVWAKNKIEAGYSYAEVSRPSCCVRGLAVAPS